MATKYFALLTSRGRKKLALAAVDGTKLNIAAMAVGDGHGTLPVPHSEQTELINEKRRDAINLLTIDPINSNQIIVEQIIPENAGGFWIREIGLYDADGEMIAVANCAESYKPQLQEGSGRTMTIRMVLIVSSTESVALKIDPSVVMATRQYVDDNVIEVKDYTYDLISELSYVFPSAFGVKADGTDCGKEFEAMIRYLMTTGKTAMLPAGEINMGKNRPVFEYESGMKPWKLMSNGTTITFDDVPPPVIDTSKKNWGSENALFTFIGKSSAEYLPEMIWENIKFDYSRQTNKGGTLPETLDICHPTPYSAGCRVFRVIMCLSPRWSNCTFSNVYGDAFWIERCTNPVVENCKFFDVSANQLVARLNKAMNLDSSGGAIFFHSCWGFRATGNLVLNRRVYQVDYLSPDTKVEMNGSPCGYIGIWAEYALDRSSLPPLVEGYTAGANSTTQSGVIRDNIISGYTMGIKTEEQAAAVIDANIIENCYLPVMCSGTFSQVTNNYIRHTGITANTVPQGGFTTRGSISLFQFGGAAAEFSGKGHQPLVSGNFVYCEGSTAPLSLYASGGIRVIGNKFVINGSGMLLTCTTSQRTGYILEDNSWIIPEGNNDIRRNTILGAARGFSFSRNTIANYGSNTLIIYFDGSDAPHGTADGNIWDGAVMLRVRCQNFTMRRNLFKLQTSISRVLEVSAPNFTLDDNTFQLPSTLGGTLMYLNTSHIRITHNHFDTSGTELPVTSPRALIEQAGTNDNWEISHNQHTGNVNNTPLLSLTAGVGGVMAHRNWTDSTSAYMIYGAGGMSPPAYMEGNAYGGGILGGFSTGDPNRIANLGYLRETPYVGMHLRYLRPGTTGNIGCVYTSAGWQEYGSIIPKN